VIGLDEETQRYSDAHLRILSTKKPHKGASISRDSSLLSMVKKVSSPPIPAISLVMLMVDSVELLQVRPDHLDLTLDQPRELLLRCQDDLLVLGCLFSLARFGFAWSAIHAATSFARAMLCSRPA